VGREINVLNRRVRRQQVHKEAGAVGRSHVKPGQLWSLIQHLPLPMLQHRGSITGVVFIQIPAKIALIVWQ
jgi:hypothetical protein